MSGLVTRQSAEYRAALEIEVWKEIQMEEHQIKMAKQEKMLFSQLGYNSAKLQEKLDKEVDVSKKACDSSVHVYKQKLAQLEKREKLFATNSAAMTQKLCDFKNERQSTIQDVQQRSSYNRDFLNLQLDGIVNKIQVAEIQNQKLLSRLSVTENTLQTKTIEFHNVEVSCRNSVSVELQNDLLQTKLDFARVKEQHSKLTANKEKYKLKLKSVLGDLSSKQHPIYPTHTSQIIRKSAVVQPKKPDKIDAPDDSVLIKDLKSELETIVSKLESEPRKSFDFKEHNFLDVDTEIAKLIGERNTLLNTGVYQSHDFIIGQIDDKIKLLLNKNI